MITESFRDLLVSFRILEKKRLLVWKKIQNRCSGKEGKAVTRGKVIVDSQLLDQSGLAAEGTAASLGDKLFYLFILLLSLIRLADISWIPPVFPAVNLR